MVHSALCTRVLLNLRKAAARVSSTEIDDFTLGTLAFEHPTTQTDADTELHGEAPLSSYELNELDRCGRG